MKMKSAIAAIAAVIVAGIGLSGCAPGQAPAENTEKTLRIAQSAPPGNFTIGAWSGGESLLSTAVYDTPVILSPEGELLPGIAESWQYSKDKTELTFHIRDGMKFTDGAPVDADAVVASFQALRKGPASSQGWVNVSTVKAADKSTVVVNLSQPDASFLPSLTGSVGAIGSSAALTAQSSKLKPVGSGPYTLNETKTVVGSKYILDRNPDNWNVKAYPYAHIEVSVIADATAAQNALRSGQIDVLPTAGQKSVVDQFPSTQFNSGENHPTGAGVLWLSDRAGEVVPALADERVRKAINLAIDRQSIATKLLGPGNGPTNQVVSPSNKAFSKELLNEDPYDPNRARTLMAEAGYADGFAVTMPSTIVSQQIESTLTQSLADIGIKVSWKAVPLQEFDSKVYAKTYGMYYMFIGLSAFDAQDIRASLSGAYNPFNWTTPEFDKLRKAANAAPVDQEAAAFGAVNKYLVEHSWNAPVAYSNGYWVASKNIKYTAPTAYNLNLLPYAPANG